MNKRYYKLIDDKTVFYKGESIVLDNARICNPTEEQLLEAGWMIYIEPPVPEPTPQQLLQEAKDRKIAEINAYDNSSEVNECLISYQGATITYWADKNERNALKNAVQDCVALGRTTYRLDLREYDVSITIPCQSMIGMLQQLEGYAIDCYNTTSDHIYAVKVLDNVEDVESYDYTLNYPQKITFEL